VLLFRSILAAGLLGEELQRLGVAREADGVEDGPQEAGAATGKKTGIVTRTMPRRTYDRDSCRNPA